MNRMGMDDYVQPLYPEDEVVHSGNYLIIRSYQDFLNERLARIKVSHPGKEFDKFADVYAIPNIDEIDSKSKGRSSIVGLWMHTDDSRESLIEVMRKCVFAFLFARYDSLYMCSAGCTLTSEKTFLIPKNSVMVPAGLHHPIDCERYPKG